MSDPEQTGTEQSGPSEGPDPWCTWCHFEPPDDELPYRIKGEDDGRWPPAFCSLQCAARWGNAAHQDRIYHVEHGRGLRTDGGEPQETATGRIGAAEKMLPTEGNAPDYVVAVGDELVIGVDQGGDADGAYSEGEVYLGGKRHRVMVRYSIDGMSAVSIASARNPDEWISYEPADEQPDTGTLWLPPLDYLPEIRTLPETEVDKVLDR
jgi:hypothetical protein